MRREYLVGTVVEMDVVQFKDGKRETAQYLLTELLGEGAEQAAYAVRRIDIPQDKLVIGFPKSSPCLEMRTLNHKFRVYEELYPDHPLRMSSDERLELLKAEILSYVILDHFIFRFEVCRDLLSKTVIIIRRDLKEPFDAGELLEDKLESSAIRPFVDRNLALNLESLIDEGRIEEADRPFFEGILAAVRNSIEKWESAGCHMPISRNPLANLVGLHSEDYINEAELLAIADSAECVAMVTAGHIDALFKLGTILHYHAQERFERYKAAKERQRDHEELSDHRSREAHKLELIAVKQKKALEAALVAFRLLEEVATKRADQRYYVGIARVWRARITMIDDEKLFEAGDIAVSALEERLSVADLHDALLVWSRSMRAIDAKKSESLLGAASSLAAYIADQPAPEAYDLSHEVRYYLSEAVDAISHGNAQQAARAREE